MPDQPTPTLPDTHRWSYDLRKWVIIGLVVASAFFLYFIRDTLPVIVLTLLLAYLLNPLVVWVQKRLHVRRALAIVIVYVVFIAILIGLGVLFVPNLVRQVTFFVSDFDRILVQVITDVEKLPFIPPALAQLDPQVVIVQLRTEASALGRDAPEALIGAASSVLRIAITLVLSFYLLLEAETFGKQISSAVPPYYKADADHITADLNAIWSGFLRGQVVLALIIGIVTTITLTVLGVRASLFLGLLAGVLEVVPNIGPIIAAVPAVLIAFVQGSSNWAVDNTIFALIVIAAYVIIQQLENHLVVPNVLGKSVNLPPVLILAGTLIGGSLAGVLGIFLAAPLIATARLFFQYVAHKLAEPLPDESRMDVPYMDSSHTSASRGDASRTDASRTSAQEPIEDGYA